VNKKDRQEFLELKAKVDRLELTTSEALNYHWYTWDVVTKDELLELLLEYLNLDIKKQPSKTVLIKKEAKVD
jgi:hypothetical protein